MLRLKFCYLGLSIVLVGLILMSLSVGSIHIPLKKVFYLLQHPDSSVESIVMQTVRIPRTICAVMVGAALALAGVILLYIVRNDLTCPSLLGINQGVYLGMALCVVLSHGSTLTSLFAYGIVWGALAGLLTYYLSYKIGFTPLKLILVGQTVNLFCYAASQLLLMLFPNQADSLVANLGGSLANSSWFLLNSFAWVLIISMLLTLVLLKKNYILSLGDEMAKSIGMNVGGYLILFLLIILLVCTCSVVIAGPLLFFSLLAVQSSKLIISSNHPYHFAMVSILMGGIFLVGSDILIRGIYPNWEAPLNMFVAMLGVPVLIMRARSMR